MKDVLIFLWIIIIAILLASFLGGCVKYKATSSDLICKYRSINCDSIDSYEDKKSCFVNEALKKEFCE